MKQCLYILLMSSFVLSGGGCSSHDDAQIHTATVVAGQSDNNKTIDWEYNIKFLEGKFSDAQVSMIEGAGHELFNESAKIRKEVFSQISSYLEGE